MADNVAPTYAKSDVKSGVENEQYASKTLGGIPEKKSVEEIEKVNTVKNVSGSVAK